MDIDTSNDSMVGVQGKLITILRLRSVMTTEEALRLAAWLVALADREDKFPALLKAVRNT